MKLTIAGLKEYAKLFPTLISQSDKILEGIVNQVKMEFDILPEPQQTEIARRRAICAECPFNSSNAVVNGYKTNRIDEHCSLCACTITRKTASLSAACGIDCCNALSETNCDCDDKSFKNYNVIHDITIKPKWTAFKSTNNEQETGSTN